MQGEEMKVYLPGWLDFMHTAVLIFGANEIIDRLRNAGGETGGRGGYQNTERLVSYEM
jgi:hypothetical protein